ncbi:hypothetical protein E1A91_D12G030600v1 [Gossypium mustelinum]|uniref:Uncharacterized protein n=1 Tax=Gossypium mustelinum TaxID=34275 RepID=A0A5D2S9Z3_GOSMU|nr:hypothetical protein E1A91_D12G030600v1 [Gossypium mustelinum]
MITYFKKSFSLQLSISMKAFFPFSSLVTLVNFPLVCDEHNPKHHLADATSEWRTVFDSKSSPLHLVLPILKQIWKIVDQKLRQSKLSPAFSYRHVYGLCLFLRITKVRNKKYDIVR